MKLISRQQAKLQGLTRYYTGHPCKYRHIAERKVCDQGCIECARLRSRKRYADNPELVKIYSKRWYQSTRIQQNQKSKNYRTNNREKILQLNAKFKRERRDIINANIAKRHAAIIRAVPRWFENEKKAIAALYTKSKQLTETTGITYNVDHIIPLQSDLVCGLHCLANLQVITEQENQRKSNKLTE